MINLIRLEKQNIWQFLVANALFLVFIAINCTFNYLLLKDNIAQQEKSVFERVQIRIQDWIDSSFKEVNKISSILQASPINEDENLSQLLFSLQKSSNFPYLILGLENGKFYISDKNFINPHNYTPTLRDWYIDTLKEGKTVATKPYFSMRLGLRSVSICTPVKIGGLNGVFCGGRPFKSINSYFLEYKNLYDKNLFLMDKSGEILGQTDTNGTVAPKIEEMVAFSLKGTNWLIVFEKNSEIYRQILSKFFIINFLLYALFITIFLVTNFFWYHQNRRGDRQLQQQGNFIKNVLSKRKNSFLITCDSKFNITNSDDVSFYDILNHGDLRQSLSNSTHIANSDKGLFLDTLEMALASDEELFFEIKIDENEFLITMAKTGGSDISVLFQDISYMDKKEGMPNYDIDMILFFIMKNLDDFSLSIEKIGRISGYSKFHFQRIFKNFTGKNVATYLRELRVQKAAFFLKFSDMKVLDIARICGFDHGETLARGFKKHFGISPSAYKQLKTSPVNELIYDEIELEELNLRVSFWSESFEKDEKRYYISYNIFNQTLFGVESDTKNKLVIKFAKGRYARINFAKTKLNLEETIEKIQMVFYDQNLHALEIPLIFYTKNQFGDCQFLYIKID